MDIQLVTRIRQQLVSLADEGTRESGQRFFKEAVTLHGVKSALVSRLSKDIYTEIKGQPKNEIFALCEKLWQSGYLEESFVACNLSYYIHKQYQAEDIDVFEAWINKYITNWASCDTFCNHSVSALIDLYPQYLERLKQWALSSNRWVRRASAVSLIIPARRGRYLPDIFEIADILLTDKEDLVQKGYGWMLKAASEAHQKAVFDYVVHNKQRMPRTALRYAIEKMPKDLKVEAMKRG